jgi:hypothetical protein
MNRNGLLFWVGLGLTFLAIGCATAPNAKRSPRIGIRSLFPPRR